MSNYQVIYLPGRQKVVLEGINSIHISVDLKDGRGILTGLVDINLGSSEFLGAPHLTSDKISFIDPNNTGKDALISYLWLILNWYFQLPAPSTALTPGKKGGPQGTWKVQIDTTQGHFSDPENLDAAAATGLLSFSSSSPTAHLECYVARSSFWQVPPDYFLSLLGGAHDGTTINQMPPRFPKPAEHTITNGIRHPLRPRPRAIGDLYTRWIPSLNQCLTFRLASVDEDAELLHRWMNDPRVAEFWGEDGGDVEKTRGFLKKGLGSQHCYPVIGSWDGEPFGYFEVYWVKEDSLGKFVTDCDSWDRGVHCLVGEQKFRGPQRVGVWISSLVHCEFVLTSFDILPSVDYRYWWMGAYYGRYVFGRSEDPNRYAGAKGR